MTRAIGWAWVAVLEKYPTGQPTVEATLGQLFVDEFRSRLTVPARVRRA